MDSARKGKIASLPAKIREEINRRLHDGQTGPDIASWLNQQSDVLRVLFERWDEEPITPQNLSEWRRGGFQDWLARNEKVSALKTLSDYSLQLAQAAGGSISEGAAAIAGGRILELLEKSAASIADATAGEESEGGFELGDLIESLTKLRSAEIAQKRTDQRDIVLSQRDRQLALEEKRFQRQTAEMFMKFYEDRRAKEIMEAKGPKDVKMDQLVTLMFGENLRRSQEAAG